MAKTLKLIQTTIENDPTKGLMQILRDDMKHSRELEMRYFQLMCGLLAPNGNPNMPLHGNLNFYSSSNSDNFHHQSHNFAQQYAPVLRTTSSSRPSTPSYGYSAPTASVRTIDHFTVVAKLPGLRMEARLPVTLF